MMEDGGMTIWTVADSGDLRPDMDRHQDRLITLNDLDMWVTAVLSNESAIPTATLAHGNKIIFPAWN